MSGIIKATLCDNVEKFLVNMYDRLLKEKGQVDIPNNVFIRGPDGYTSVSEDDLRDHIIKTPFALEDGGPTKIMSDWLLEDTTLSKSQYANAPVEWTTSDLQKAIHLKNTGFFLYYVDCHMVQCGASLPNTVDTIDFVEEVLSGVDREAGLYLLENLKPTLESLLKPLKSRIKDTKFMVDYLEDLKKVTTMGRATLIPEIFPGAPMAVFCIEYNKHIANFRSLEYAIYSIERCLEKYRRWTLLGSDEFANVQLRYRDAVVVPCSRVVAEEGCVDNEHNRSQSLDEDVAYKKISKLQEQINRLKRFIKK